MNDSRDNIDGIKKSLNKKEIDDIKKETNNNIKRKRQALDELEKRLKILFNTDSTDSFIEDASVVITIDESLKLLIDCQNFLNKQDDIVFEDEDIILKTIQLQSEIFSIYHLMFQNLLKILKMAIEDIDKEILLYWKRLLQIAINQDISTIDKKKQNYIEKERRILGRINQISLFLSFLKQDIIDKATLSSSEFKEYSILSKQFQDKAQFFIPQNPSSQKLSTEKWLDIWLFQKSLHFFWETLQTEDESLDSSSQLPSSLTKMLTKENSHNQGIFSFASQESHAPKPPNQLIAMMKREQRTHDEEKIKECEKFKQYCFHEFMEEQNFAFENITDIMNTSLFVHYVEKLDKERKKRFTECKDICFMIAHRLYTKSEWEQIEILEDFLQGKTYMLALHNEDLLSKVKKFMMPELITETLQDSIDRIDKIIISQRNHQDQQDSYEKDIEVVLLDCLKILNYLNDTHDLLNNLHGQTMSFSLSNFCLTNLFSISEYSKMGDDALTFKNSLKKVSFYMRIFFYNIKKLKEKNDVDIDVLFINAFIFALEKTQFKKLNAIIKKNKKETKILNKLTCLREITLLTQDIVSDQFWTESLRKNAKSTLEILRDSFNFNSSYICDLKHKLTEKKSINNKKNFQKLLNKYHSLLEKYAYFKRLATENQA